MVVPTQMLTRTDASAMLRWVFLLASVARIPVNRREPQPPSLHFFAQLLRVGADAIASKTVTASFIHGDLLTDVLVKSKQALVFHL
jgi:hypothetical protein